MQSTILIITLLLIAGVAGVFLWVAAGASQTGSDAATMARSAYRLRGRLFWVVIAAGAAISLATLWDWPISGHAAAAPKADITERGTGQLFRWELDRDTVPTGQLVEFELTSLDVNHGFAIYKDKSRLIAQAQVMPGYVNKLQVRFAEPGDYEVMCLEYCGIAHHGMRTTIKVR